MRIRDPGWRLFGSGMEKSRIRDKHPGSATLVMTYGFTCIVPSRSEGESRQVLLKYPVPILTD